VERDVTITLKRGGRERDVVIRPYSRGAYRLSVWERDQRAERARVEEQSNGRLGYINLRNMGSASIDQFEKELYAVANGKDGLVIDVRDNSGGWVTDILLHSLLAGDHAFTVPRGGGPGYPAPRRLIYAWTKPVIVLANASTFSNGEIFAWSIQTLGRGKVVGQETFGGVISTGGRRLLDGTWVRRPFRGWYVNRNGAHSPEAAINMEAQGCVPDIPVEMPPDARANGRDPQLDRAVTELLHDLAH
jgi:tricorn protease